MRSGGYVRASVKYLEKNKWKHLELKDCIGKSIAYIMSKDERTMVAALLDDKDKPVFFLTNTEEQYSKYKERGLAMRVDDLILLLGSETIPSHPVTEACLKVFPNGTFEAIQDERKERDKKQWW